MKKFLWLALLSALLSSFGHFYLAKRSYQLTAGAAPEASLCHIGENLSCDGALLSPYSSLFGISLSNFGLSLNLFLSILLAAALFFGLSLFWKNMAFFTAAGSAAGSAAMAVISLVYDLFCPICWTLYTLSFAISFLLFFAFKKDLQSLPAFIKSSWRRQSFYGAAGGMLLFSLFLHISFTNAFNIKPQAEMLEAVLMDWRHEAPARLDSPPILQKSFGRADVAITEFADFLCPACKNAHSSLKSFLQKVPDIKFQFYVYPLDGACNPAIKMARTGLSCSLSKAAVCAEKQNKGWAVHDFIFEKQRSFLAARGDKKTIQSLFQELKKTTGLEAEAFDKCMKSSAAAAQIKRSAEEGESLGIRGTPSFFINGRQIPYFSPGLIEQIYKRLKKSR